MVSLLLRDVQVHQVSKPMENIGEEDQQSSGVSLEEVTRDLGIAEWALPDEMREGDSQRGCRGTHKRKEYKGLEEEEIHMWKGLVWLEGSEFWETQRSR